MIRERRYEEALRKTSKQMTTENEMLMEKFVETESNLQRALLDKLNLEEQALQSEAFVEVDPYNRNIDILEIRRGGALW